MRPNFAPPDGLFVRNMLHAKLVRLIGLYRDSNMKRAGLLLYAETRPGVFI